MGFVVVLVGGGDEDVAHLAAGSVNISLVLKDNVPPLVGTKPLEWWVAQWQGMIRLCESGEQR